MLLCFSYVVMSCLFAFVTGSQHKVFFRVVVTWRYVAKHGGHLLEQCSLEQKADFYRHLNRIVILPSGLLSCFFDFTYPSPHNPHFPQIISSHSPARFNSYLLAHATANIENLFSTLLKTPKKRWKRWLFRVLPTFGPSTHSTAWKYNRNCIMISLWPCYIRSNVTVQDPVGWPTAILRFNYFANS